MIRKGLDARSHETTPSRCMVIRFAMQDQPNKAVEPTAYSFGSAPLRLRFRRRLTTRVRQPGLSEEISPDGSPLSMKAHLQGPETVRVVRGSLRSRGNARLRGRDIVGNGSRWVVRRAGLQASGRSNHPLQCAMKLSDGMGGNPLGLSQGAHEPLGLSRAGRDAA